MDTQKPHEIVQLPSDRAKARELLNQAPMSDRKWIPLTPQEAVMLEELVYWFDNLPLEDKLRRLSEYKKTKENNE